ncbi:hypothetical protein OG216_09800 [Streptomycetaceae bacterium NBC_01309]
MTDTPPRDDPQCICPLDLFACPVHPRTFEPKQVGSWWEAPIDPPVVVEAGDPVPASPYHFTRDNVTIVPDASPPLRKFWGEEADRIGERLDAERVLEIARGQDADRDRLDDFRVALTRGERWPLDSLTDPMVDVLYGELAMLRARHTPDVQQRQGAALANQAMEIGELLGLTDRSRNRPEQYHGNEWLDLGKALERLDAAEAAIARVRELHQRDSDDKCGLCRYFDTTNWGGLRTHWPCDTVRALDGDMPKETT